VNQTVTKSPGPEISNTREHGVLTGGWQGWKNTRAEGSVYLFWDGFVAPASAPAANGGPRGAGAEIIELYRRHGAEFIERLRGSFAVALWDAQEKRLLLGTDHFGTRPIYYWTGRNHIAFAPRIGHLADGGGIAGEIDRDSIFFYLNHSFIPAPFTVYKGMRRLEPGQLLVWQDGRSSIRQYWDMAYAEDTRADEAALAAGLRSAVEDSVRFSLSAGAPAQRDRLGAFLSGGTDSSALVGWLGRLGPSPVKSFSVGFQEAAYNEIHYARVAARHFGSEAHEYFVRPDEALDAMPKLGAAYDEPFGNSSAVPTYFCLRTARHSGVDVMFAGDGGDELFGGNERYITEKIFTLYQAVPRPLRAVIDRSAELVPGFYPWRKVKNYVRKANLPAVDRFFAYQLYFRDHAAEYLTDDFRRSVDLDIPLAVPQRHYQRAGDIAPLNRLLYLDLKLAVSDNDLFKVNRMAEINGIEVRYPYLDPQVGIFSGTIPAGLKVKGWTKRYIFKRAFENFLPDEILRKKKHGFGLPTGDWLRQHPGFRELARSLLLDARSIQRGYFKRAALERLLELHDRERSSYYGSHIWNLMMLELWHRHHHDGLAAQRSGDK
jgi:asparagine synthase (glutamine-hydrolysing)